MFLAPEVEEDGEDNSIPSNIIENAQLFEDNNIGLGREETFRIYLALKSLVSQEKILKEVRLWGKIFGVQSNYIIAEAQYKDGESPAVPEPAEV